MKNQVAKCHFHRHMIRHHIHHERKFTLEMLTDNDYTFRKISLSIMPNLNDIDHLNPTGLFVTIFQENDSSYDYYEQSKV